jgi:tetratricopeptide (TPR) repeat protein
VLPRELEMPPDVRGRVLRIAATLAREAGDSERASVLGQRALDELARVGDRREIAYALRALERHEDSIALFRELGDEADLAGALRAFADWLIDAGREQQAEQVLAEAADLHRQAGWLGGLAACISAQADLALHRGDLLQAQDLYKRSLTIFHRSGARRAVVIQLTGLAATAAVAGHLERAQRLRATISVLERDPELRLTSNERQRYEPTLAGVTCAAEGDAALPELDAAVAYALSPD